jgi:hypothetical protein
MELDAPTSAGFITKNTKRAPKKIRCLRNGGSKAENPPVTFKLHRV